MQIQTFYDLNIFIDDLNIFDAPGVVFVRGEIYESITNPIPSCELELNVPTNWLDYRSIVDGTQIRFSLKSEQYNINNNYDFRIFNIKELSLQQRFAHIIIEGVIDFYSGYETGNTFNLNAPSSEVFKKVASTYGLNNEIDATNDLQTWVAGENNTYQFLNYMAEYGWIDETSAMIWFIDRHKYLVYKNLTTLFRQRQDNIWIFKQTPDPNISNKEYGYTGASSSIQSGLENLKNEGYGGTDKCFNLLTYSWDDIYARKVIAESNIINISKELSKGLAQEWFPFNVGNNHANFYKAYKQNKRILSTYSSYVTLQCQFFQPYRIGQIVNFEYLDSQYIHNKIIALSGVYIINAIHISLSLKNITATVELAMQGLNGEAITREVY